jgi:two-component system phosphate regulon sensor histidine kinase PhoR
VEEAAARTVRMRAGAERHLTVSVAPLPGGETLLVAHDATEAVRYQELRKEFVANVSHELRTPLTVIRGYVETLQEGAFADPVKGPEFLEVIGRHAALLSKLVENLLDLSRLESPQGMARRLAVDMGALVARVAELHRAPAERKGQTLEARIDGPLPAVSGDPDYLERAVANLVDNALKYTPEKGAIRVAARRAGAQVVVEVEDSGIGIPPADLPRIFERFYRVDKSRSRSLGGTGLGLAIVKHIAQAHGGTVDVTSAPGRGSTFRLSVPAA